MPSSTRKQSIRVMPETEAISRLRADLAEYDQKLRQAKDELNNLSVLADQLARIADEAVAMTVNVQRIKNEVQLHEQMPNFARLERWFRDAQKEIRRLTA